MNLQSQPVSDPSSEKLPGRRKKGLLVIGLIAAVSGSAWLWRVGNRHSAGRASLAVASDRLDLGEVWQQSEFRRRLLVRNTSSEAIEIADIEVSCGCRASIEPSSLVIPAGRSTDLWLTLDLAAPASEPADALWRPFSLDLHPLVKSRLPGSLVWRLHGRVRNVFRELPQSIGFDEPCVRGTRFPSQVFTVSTHAVLADLTADCDSSQALCEVVRSQEDNREFTVKVTPSSALPVGNFAFPLRLTAVGVAQGHAPRVAIDVFGEVVRDVGAVPSTALLAVVDVSQTVRQAVRLRSLTGGEFSVTTVACESQNMKVERHGQTGRANGELRFDLVLHQPQPGLQRSCVRFRVHDRSEEYDVRVPVLYHGIAP